MKASAPRHSETGVSRNCWHLDLRAKTPADAQWMSAVYRAIVHGGELTIRPAGESEVVVEFDAIAGPAGGEVAGG